MVGIYKTSYGKKIVNMRICLIGNSGYLSNDKGGQTTKLRLYKKKIEDEGFDLFFVDLERFFHRFLNVFKEIKQGVKACDRIVLISGERACRLFVPYINKLNKKYRKQFILPVVGSGLLHFSIDHLSNEDQYKFFAEKDFSKAKKCKKIRKELSKIDYILPETKILMEAYKKFYSLSNCFVLNNFRDNNNIINNKVEKCGNLKAIYLSRVMRIKGIFDLLHIVNKISDIRLDIYGSLELDDDDTKRFYELINDKVRYLGPVENDKVINTFNKYDLLIFPSRCSYEGVPGVISESLIAGTPILSSDFPNAKCILKDSYNSVFYEMFDVDDLEAKLEWCINNKDKIRSMRDNCLESAKKFTYEYNRKEFLKYVCGVEDE